MIKSSPFFHFLSLSLVLSEFRFKDDEIERIRAYKLLHFCVLRFLYLLQCISHICMREERTI